MDALAEKFAELFDTESDDQAESSEKANNDKKGLMGLLEALMKGPFGAIAAQARQGLSVST